MVAPRGHLPAAEALFAGFRKFPWADSENTSDVINFFSCLANVTLFTASPCSPFTFSKMINHVDILCKIINSQCNFLKSVESSFHFGGEELISPLPPFSGGTGGTDLNWSAVGPPLLKCNCLVLPEIINIYIYRCKHFYLFFCRRPRRTPVC